MKEDFLHHVWQFKKFDIANLKTTKGESIQILNSGQYLQLAGPDFFNAQIVIGNQKWAGNVEIHLKSSDWYVHNHEKDSNYDSVILHVVWEHDVPVFRKDNSEIPTLELKQNGNKIDYRYTNIIDGFAMPLTLKNSNQMINPTKDWQTLNVSGVKNINDVMINPNYYITTKIVK